MVIFQAHKMWTMHYYSFYNKAFKFKIPLIVTKSLYDLYSVYLLW